MQRLVVKLFRAGLGFEERPVVLTEYPDAHFQGKVIFAACWAVGAEPQEITVDGQLHLPEQRETGRTEELLRHGLKHEQATAETILSRHCDA